MIIAVVGTGDKCTPEASALAEQVGREIARRGHTLICGGLNGVMEAVCKGAKSAGGLTIGVLPGISPLDANRYVDIPIVTDMGFARNIIIVLSAAAIIAVQGEYGTLSEVVYALGYNQPVVGLGTWKLTRPDGTVDDSVIQASGPADAVEKAIAAGERADRRVPTR